jgi:hypothetical protein
LTGTGKHKAIDYCLTAFDRFASNQQINENQRTYIMTLNARDAEGFYKLPEGKLALISTLLPCA